MSSLQETDRAAAANAKAPRVALDDIEAAISGCYYTTADKAVQGALASGTSEVSGHPDQLRLLTICILVMRNGFVVIGKSAPASPENFNAELGRTFAYEDAVRQLWPLMGYALREKLASA